MGFSKKLLYFLAHRAGYTNAEARLLLASGQITLDGEPLTENIYLHDQMEIRLGDQVIKQAKKHVYLKFFKPRGFQSSLNSSIPDGLSAHFAGFTDLAIAGRLDKESEGLLLLSNDGKWIEQICNPQHLKEKEYLVQLNCQPEQRAIQQFTSGMQIGHHHTKPCYCERLENGLLRVVLTEGKNRQIRRMFHKLGYQVLFLKRIRVDSIHLDDLQEGQFVSFVL